MASVKKYVRPGSTTTRWRARYRDRDGHEHMQTFGTKADADQWLREQTAALVRGDWADPRLGRVLFRDYATRWLADQLHYRPSTRYGVHQRLRDWILPTLGNLPLGAVRPSDVQRCVNVCAESLSPATVHLNHALLVSVFAAAVNDGHLAVTPVRGIRLPAKDTTVKSLPMDADLLATITDRLDAPFSAMLTLAAATGMRSGELRGLTADRITPALHVHGDIAPRQVTIRVDRTLGDDGTFGPPKTASSDRSITIGPSTVAVLTEHIATAGLGRDGLIFHVDGGQPITRARAGHAWRTATKGLPVRHRSGWHDARHFHASLLIASGLSPRAVASRLGHTDPGFTLRVYAALWPTDDARAVDAVEAALGTR